MFVSVQNCFIESSSGRVVAGMSISFSIFSGFFVNGFRLRFRVFLLWLNAVFKHSSSASLFVLYGSFLYGCSCRMLESTLGGGVNAWGGTLNSTWALHNHCVMTDSRP